MSNSLPSENTYETAYEVPHRMQGCDQQSVHLDVVCVREGESLEDVLAARNLDEWASASLKNYPPKMAGRHWLSDKLKRQGSVEHEELHCACHLSWLALKAGVATADEIVGDCGILHELIHWPDSIWSFKTVVEYVWRIEARVPGLHWVVGWP